MNVGTISFPAIYDMLGSEKNQNVPPEVSTKPVMFRKAVTEGIKLLATEIYLWSGQGLKMRQYNRIEQEYLTF